MNAAWVAYVSNHAYSAFCWGSAYILDHADSLRCDSLGTLSIPWLQWPYAALRSCALPKTLELNTSALLTLMKPS